jgi:GNAT superfamily N-acetyltransferase
MVWSVHEVPVEDPEAIALLRAFMQELIDRYNGRPMPAWEVDAQYEIDPNTNIVAFFVGRYDGVPAACAGLREYGALTRMYVRPEFRRTGGARVLIAAVEDAARRLGMTRVRIDTRDDLIEARTLYTAIGYATVDPFSEEPYADHFFEKLL